MLKKNPNPQRFQLKKVSVVPLMKQLKVYTVVILRKTKKSNLSAILFYKENTA